MDVTYKLDWNTLKEGSLIKFKSENVIYRVWSLAADGTAEIIPISAPKDYDINKWYNIPPQYAFGAETYGQYIARNGNTYYLKNAPMTLNSYNTNVVPLTPFYNYLITVKGPNWTTWTSSLILTPSSHSNEYDFRIQKGSLPNIQNYNYYNLGFTPEGDTNSYKWRPLTMNDLLSKFGKSVHNDTLRKVFGYDLTYYNNTHFLGIYDLVAITPISYPSASGTTFAYDGNAELSNGSRDLGMPIFKLNLLECRNLWILLRIKE